VLTQSAGEHSSTSAKGLKGLNLHYKEISSLMLINLGKPYKYLHCAATKNNAEETQPRVGVRSLRLSQWKALLRNQYHWKLSTGVSKGTKYPNFNFPSNAGAFL